MATKQVEVPGVGVVSLYKRAGNKSLRLSIGSDGEIRVSLPFWLPFAAGAKFAATKAEWIAQHRNVTTTAKLEHGAVIGKAHRLHFASSFEATKVQTRLKENQICITHPLRLKITDEEVQQAAHKAALRALKKEADALLPQRLQTLAGKHQYTFSTVSTKPMKTRWGSCSSRQEIILNIYLMQLPWHLIDYVLMHELAHTKVMRHGAPFWAEMQEHIPHVRILKKQMAKHKPVLAPGGDSVA